VSSRDLGTRPGFLERLAAEWRVSWPVRRARLVRWQLARRRGEFLETTIQPGVRMRLDLGSRLSELLFFWDFERSERTFLNAFLRPGDVFVDIGAHVGLYTLIAARVVGPSGMVCAFEPASTTFARLLANVEINSLTNVTCWNMAVSDAETELELNVGLAGFDAWTSLAHPTRGGVVARQRVTCVRWADFAERHSLVGRVTMMKIDVEGWERRVLAGASEVLKRDDAPLLQVEFADEAAASGASSCQELYHILQALGYELFRYDLVAGLRPEPLRESYPYTNLLAIKDVGKVVKRLRG
jgi:FkbM family methyltransferase